MNRRRNPWLARLLVLTLACSMALTFVVASAPSAHAQAPFQFLGLMDLRGYCQSQGYADVTTIGNTYYDWRCIGTNHVLSTFSMRSACQWQYHTSDAWDITNNFNSLTSGECLSANLLGNINLRAYCQSLGYLDVTLRGSTAYDWYCTQRTLFGLNYIHIAGTNSDEPGMGFACYWMYGDSIARFTNFYSATSWQCLG